MAEDPGFLRARESINRPDYSRQKKYNDNNTTMKAVRLNLKTDLDILDYLEGKAFQTEVKKALRLLIQLEEE